MSLTPRYDRTVCDICRTSGARVRRITRSYGKGEDLLLIENIPAVTCPHCGGTYSRFHPSEVQILDPPLAPP
jgi:YgiT-type zinc finger domain-containing protein